MELHISNLEKRIAAVQALLDESGRDNRLVEEELSERVKNNMRLVSELEHPLADLKAADSVFADNGSGEFGLSAFQLRREVDSVALDWRSLRNIKECACSTPFDHFSKKVGFRRLRFDP